MLLVTRVEEAVVALNKFLMTLEEVHHLISQLWNVEVSRLQLKEILFLNTLSNNIKILEPEIVESFIRVALKSQVVLLISAE